MGIWRSGECWRPSKCAVMTVQGGRSCKKEAIALNQILPLIHVTLQNWLNDRAPRLGAALAFYMALSLAPTLVILLAIAGLVFSTKAAESRLMLELQGLMGYQGAQVVQSIIEGAHGRRTGLWALLLGLVPLFV